MFNYFQKNTQSIFHILFAGIDFDEYPYDDDLTKCLKQEGAKWACIFDLEECIKASNYNLMRHIENPLDYK